MAARMRAPGLGRAGLFTLLGVLFAAVLVTVVRLAYGFSNPFDGASGWDVKWQDAVLTVGLPQEDNRAVGGHLHSYADQMHLDHGPTLPPDGRPPHPWLGYNSGT